MKPTKFEDAVRLLEAGDSKAMTLIDRLASGGIIGAAFVTGGSSLSLIGAKNDFVKHGNALIGKASTLRLGAMGADQSSRLIAAHSVLVVTSYVESLGEGVKKSSRKSLMFDKTDITQLERRVRSVSREPFVSPDAAQRRWFDEILQKELPYPDSMRSFTELQQDIFKTYTLFGDEVKEFIEDHRLWGEVNDNDRVVIVNGILPDAPARALAKYKEKFYKLAASCPIFHIWANLQFSELAEKAAGKQADEVRARLADLSAASRGLETSFAGFERLLSSAGLRNAHHAATEASIRARAELDWPIVDATPFESNSSLQFPRLRDGYVNPAGRVAMFTDSSRPADDAWWESADQPSYVDQDKVLRMMEGGKPSYGDHLRESTDPPAVAKFPDLQAKMAGLIVGPHATQKPMLVLGQPGAGKSVLMRILAARLAELGFLAFRVELRHVEPDSPIRAQIEEAIYNSTGERTSWSEVVRSAPDSSRVILLDGFDELLQATGISQSDYLERIYEFQQQEQELNRPVAVIVTARTIVADRIRYPRGCVLIRLDPFTNEQIGRWSEIWLETNKAYYSRLGRRFSAASVIEHHPSLASQPLLLLMLALYDADAGDLDKIASNTQRGQLYEQILHRFIRREIVKGATRLDEPALAAAVDQEMIRLAVAAYAMFNRARQSVGERNLDQDLNALNIPSTGPTQCAPTNFGGSLTPARQLLSRFFFIYDSNARILGSDTAAYEFLHATFGEYLVARLAASTAISLAIRTQPNPGIWSIPEGEIDDGLLFALLSFTTISSRSAAVEFLCEKFRRSGNGKEHLDILIPKILSRALSPTAVRSFSNYRPSEIHTVTRQAIYTANLIVLFVAASAEPVPLNKIFGTAEDAMDNFRQLAYLWKSQLPPAAWRGLVQTVRHGEVSVTGGAATQRCLMLRSTDPSMAFPELVSALDVDVVHGRVGDLLEDLTFFDEPGARELASNLGRRIKDGSGK